MSDVTARPQRFQAIEGLRAFAALSVLLYHTVTHYNVATLEYSTWEWINRLGNFGVSAFFLISGFLLFRPYVVAHLTERERPNIGRFYTRRFLRIIPGYWVAISAAAFLSYISFGDWTDWLTAYGLLGNYRGGYQLFGLGVEWTLSIEISYYLLLPVIAAGLFRLSPATADVRRKVRGHLAGLAGLYVLTMALRIWRLWGTDDSLAPRGVWFPMQQLLDKTVIGYFDWFALGMALAVGSAWVTAGGRLPWVIQKLAANPLVSWLLAAQASWVALQLNLPVSVFDPVTRVQTFGIAFVYGFVALLLLVPAVFGDADRGPVRHVLANRVVVALGTISYGIYLWHLIVIKRIEQWTASGAIDPNLFVWLALVVSITLVVATASWFLVEKPFIRLSGRSWVDRITDPTTKPARFGPRTRELRSFAELLGASGIAFAQPLLDLLGKNPSIFVERRTTVGEAVLFATLVVVGPAVAITALELVVGAFSARLRRGIHAIAVGLLIGLFALQFAKTLTEWSPGPLVATAMILGLAGLAAFVAIRQFAMVLQYLAIAGVLYGLLFIGFSPASDAFFGGGDDVLGAAKIDNPARVVMILFDELPSTSLLDGSGRVDADLYPNFAKLSESSTWYRNATTVSPYTQTAVPAIVTGNYPERNDALPSTADYPENLFTVLSGAYSMNVHEAVTSLCPENICVDQSSGGGFRGLLSISRDLWTEFAAPSRSEFSFNEFEGALEAVPTARRFRRSLQPAAADEPRLDFVHIELPHQPWHYLPDLRDTTVIAGAPGSKYFAWSDQESADVAYRRHILQLQAADTLLGQTIDRLREQGAWDDSLVIVAADHGISFTDEQPLRSVSEENYANVMWVPLFVHYPGELDGRVDDRAASTIDIMPTVADVLQIGDAPDFDGISLRAEPREDGVRRMYQNGRLAFEPPDALQPPEGRQYLEFDGPEGWKVVERAEALPPGDELRVYRRGEFGSLVGQPVGERIVEGSGNELAYIANQGAFDNVAPGAKQVPWAYGEGYVNRLAEESDVAIAVNGVVANVTRARLLNDEGDAFFMFLVPPSVMVDGKNELSVYLVGGTPSDPTLDPITLNR